MAMLIAGRARLRGGGLDRGAGTRHLAFLFRGEERGGVQGHELAALESLHHLDVGAAGRAEEDVAPGEAPVGFP